MHILPRMNVMLDFILAWYETELNVHEIYISIVGFVAQLKDRPLRKWSVLGSNLTVDKNFLYCNTRLLRVTRIFSKPM